MGQSTFSGPVQSVNGFRHVAKNSVSGLYDDFTTLAGTDIRRYALAEYWSKRPALNAVIATAYDNADATNASNTAITTARVIANKDFEILGSNMTTTLVTFDTTRAGLTITTAGADEDQAIIAPHLDANQTAWASVLWGTENSVHWECSISTNAIDNIKIWAGLKLTNDQLVATDLDQAYFLFETDGDNGTALTDFTLLHFVHSINGTDYISALPITVAANTTYHLRVEINSDRLATIFVNGVQYNVTGTAGSTGGTAVTSVGRRTSQVTKTAALSNDIDLIPYIGVEAGDGNPAILDAHYQGISRIIFE